MDFKVFGCILLIVGTSIGAGMLALPIATAQQGFIYSTVLLIVCWFIMTMGALLLLEVNLWLPENSSLISMARKTIGPLGQILAWLSFLFLLYVLLCAYIASGSDLFRHILLTVGFPLPQWICPILFTLIFGSIVYLGIRSVDYTNRFLMFFKFVTFFLLIASLIFYINFENLQFNNLHYFISNRAITITITSFGYAAIIPSLRIYFRSDVKKLRQAILIGSFIPLICYWLWDAVVMGVIPLAGPRGLLAILSSNQQVSSLVKALTLRNYHALVDFCVKFFTSICILTSFLGVAISLFDFLADGFSLAKEGPQKIIIQLLTFLPPVFIVIFFPGIFIRALEYAGICAIILLILLPAWMAWRGRYILNLASNAYRAPVGKTMIFLMVIFSCVVIIQSIGINFFDKMG